MAKTYNFRFTIRRAEFHPDTLGASVPYGNPRDVYFVQWQDMTFREAISYLHAISGAENRPHYATISMDSGDRKPPGWTKTRTYLYGGEGARTV